MIVTAVSHRFSIMVDSDVLVDTYPLLHNPIENTKHDLRCSEIQNLFFCPLLRK